MSCSDRKTGDGSNTATKRGRKTSATDTPCYSEACHARNADGSSGNASQDTLTAPITLVGNARPVNGRRKKRIDTTNCDAAAMIPRMRGVMWKLPTAALHFGTTIKQSRAARMIENQVGADRHRLLHLVLALMETPLSPNSRINRLRGYLRLWRNQCPRCNSDAPLVDRCGTCNVIYFENGNVGKNMRGLSPYPPTLPTKALWLYSWLHPHAESKQRHMDGENH